MCTLKHRGFLKNSMRSCPFLRLSPFKKHIIYPKRLLLIFILKVTPDFPLNLTPALDLRCLCLSLPTCVLFCDGQSEKMVDLYGKTEKVR